MGRSPHGGTPVFRFTHTEVAEMDAYLRRVNNAIPSRDVTKSFAEKFSASADRVGKTAVQFKQVWNWFQNRRYAVRAKMTKAPPKLNVSPTRREDSVPYRNTTSSEPSASGRNSSQNGHMEFEARSARDGAWYDIATFLSHRVSETGDPEVQIQFTGFGNEEDEWIDIRKCVRLRSLPCEPSECVVILPGDLVLCFQEGKDQALYFDAHVLDAQRRRHDIRGCRCRFLVRYDHDQSEEIVPLRKICRRPETNCRLQMLHTSKPLVSIDTRSATKDTPYVSVTKDLNMTEQKASKLPAVFDVNTIAEEQPDEESTPVTVEAAIPATTFSNSSTVVPDPLTGDAAMTTRVDGNP